MDDENGAANLPDQTEQRRSDADALAKIAGLLVAHGHAGEGPYVIADVVATILTSHDRQAKEIASLKRSLAAQKGQATRAKAAAAAAEAEAVELARSATAEARVLPAAEGFEAVSPDDLLMLIGGAEQIHVIATDGSAEVLGIPPLVLSGPEAFRHVGSGLGIVLSSWIVHGPATGAEPYRVGGWALVLDGEIAAFQSRPMGQLSIGPGQSFNLAGDVIV